MKKHTVLLLVLVLTLLSACGGGGTEPNTETWTVSFDLDGGTVDGAETLADVEVTKGSSLGAKLKTPERTGAWGFGGWFDESVEPFKEYRADTPITKDLTLKAKWTNTDDTKWVVTFNTDGAGSIPSIKVTKGEGMGDQYPDDPEKDGYIFEGWYLASDTEFEGDKYDDTTPITDNTDLKAKWKSTAITIVIDEIGKEGADSVTASPASGLDGAEITLNYTLANTKKNNRLTFSGTTAAIEEVDEAGTGTRTYTIAEEDATDGVITIIATFAHSNKTLDTIAFANTNNETIVYGTTSFSKAITTTGSGSGAISYSSSDTTVATVNSATGAVTIVKVGHTTIIATKAADETYEHATAEYLLTVEPLQLYVTDGQITLSKVYDGTTTAAVVKAGTLGNKVGSDNVTVTATATYDNANVGTGKTITIVYSISGADAGNYIKPVNFNATGGSITIAPGADVNTNPTAEAKTDTTITSSVVTTSGEQSVEYAIHTASTPVPTSGWQDGLTFSGLTASTGYYIFARSKADANHNAGTAKVSSEITTDAPPLILKYNFGAGDTIPAGYPKYADVGTGSGNTFTATIDSSNAPGGNFKDKTILRVAKNYNGGSPKFILPFNLGDKTLADFSAILVIARGAAASTDHGNKSLIAIVGSTTTQIGASPTSNIENSSGFHLATNATNTETKGVVVPITIANPSNYSGSIEIGFYINSANLLNYEILSISLMPSFGYNFPAGDDVTSEGGPTNSTHISGSIEGTGSSRFLVVTKTNSNTNTWLMLPFDIGEDVLSDYVGIYIGIRETGSGADVTNKPLNIYLGSSTTAIATWGNTSLNANTTTLQGRFVAFSNPGDSSGEIKIGIGMGQTSAYVIKIDSIALIK